MSAPHHSVFTGRMPFLTPNQQRQSTEGTEMVGKHKSVKLTFVAAFAVHRAGTATAADEDDNNANYNSDSNAE